MSSADFVMFIGNLIERISMGFYISLRFKQAYEVIIPHTKNDEIVDC